MENKKITKREYYGMVREIVENSNCETKEELLAFVDKEVATLEAKAEKSRERAAIKKAEGDELRAVIKSVLTNEFQTADDILAQIEGEDVTVAKIRARLTQLVNNGEATKEDIKSEDGKTKKGYKLA